MAETLNIGWGEADITPDGKVELHGQYYQRVSQGIHSRLKAVALAMERGDQQSVMVSLDIVNVAADFQRELQDRMKNKLSFDPRNVFLNAIHTHSAPATTKLRDWWERDPGAICPDAYRAFLLDKLETLVLDAWTRRRPGGIAHGLGFARVGHCRRAVYSDGTAEMYGSTNRDDFMGMEGGEDSGVDLLFCFDESGKPTGAVVNVPCPSQVMEATYKISSDYMGRLRELLKGRFGGNFRTLCQIAPAGDQSPRDLTRASTTVDFWNEAGVEIIAARLMAAIESVYDELAANIDFDAALRHSVRRLTLPRRRASFQDYLNARNAVERLEAVKSSKDAYREFCVETHANETIPNRPGPYDNKLNHFVIIRNNEAVVKRAEGQDAKPTFEMQLHVVRLGNVVFASNPFELYQEFGQRIRARSRAKQTFMVQLCAGSGGYLPSRRAEELGGYGGLIINGEVGSDGGTMLVEETAKEITALFSGR